MCKQEGRQFSLANSASFAFEGLPTLTIKVSANPKLTVLNNFGFLYDSINFRNSFHLKKIHKKMLFVREVI